ncbi:DUF1707 domain-containing protein [Streptomyces sp. 130]|uniref:DUF1707 SHOCT-like domain-containing protein n=1 Tax=Streptomyces sp. 130 TaxID=2591006 RepID=UPI0011814845|nr:DUF1707 domain-containing protein [Streptomyces sp. 130]TRV77782.1 DUF1707 domain-containing protein [Streptomyces sp. 130]
MTAEPARSTDRLRASDADREAVVEQLREAAAEGRIDMEELDERLNLALTAKTYGELAPITEDLGGPAVRSTAEPLVLRGGIHGVQRKGAWQVPSRVLVHGGIGGALLDFSGAECRVREVEIEVEGQMGGVRIVVPDGWGVDTDALDPALGGLKSKVTGERTPGAPLLRITGSCGVGGVRIRRPGLRERRRKR